MSLQNHRYICGKCLFVLFIVVVLVQALIDVIQDNGEPPKKKLYELKLSLLEELGWSHLVSYERRWMHVRFPPSLPLF